MKFSKAICWIDDCRIPFVDDSDKGSAKPQGKTLKHKGWDNDKWLQETIEPHTQGRFPANILVLDDMLNDGVISGQNKEWQNNSKINASKIYGGGKGLPPIIHTIKTDKGTNSRYYDIDKWFEKILEYE